MSKSATTPKPATLDEAAVLDKLKKRLSTDERKASGGHPWGDRQAAPRIQGSGANDRPKTL